MNNYASPKPVKIYVVFGTTGEYSDRSEWLVRAFRNEDEAKVLVLNATRRAKELEATKESRYTSPKEKNEYDPDMEMDYTGTSYYYGVTDLI